MTWTDEEITERLFVEDVAAPGVAAVVFGSASPARARLRVERAVALHHDGLVPTLLLSGGACGDGARCEAELMADHARRLGVPDRALVLETHSTNTFENARFSATTLETMGMFACAATLLLVSAPWHLSRVVRTMRARVRPETRLLAVPSTEAESAATWRRDEATRATVQGEARIFEAFCAAGLLGPR